LKACDKASTPPDAASHLHVCAIRRGHIKNTTVVTVKHLVVSPYYLVEARILVGSGRPEAALVGMRLFELLEGARASLFAGVRSDASHWLGRFYALAARMPHSDAGSRRARPARREWLDAFTIIPPLL